MNQEEFAIRMNELLSEYENIPAIGESMETSGPKILDCVNKLIAVVKASHELVYGPDDTESVHEQATKLKEALEELDEHET